MAIHGDRDLETRWMPIPGKEDNAMWRARTGEHRKHQAATSMSAQNPQGWALKYKVHTKSST